MNTAQISLQTLAETFALPPGEPPRRVPKATLAENVPTAADRRLIDQKLARLEWIASVNQASTGIATATVNGLTVDTINLMSARTRGPMPPRLAEIIHRAIPKPVILLYRDEHGDQGAALSLAPKRKAERELGRVVSTGLFDTGPLSHEDDEFLAELALPRLPTRDLGALYAGLIERVEGLMAARRAQRPFRLAENATELSTWRSALEQITEHEAEVARLSTAIRKESRLSAKVELGEKVRQAKIRLDDAQVLLK